MLRYPPYRIDIAARSVPVHAGIRVTETELFLETHADFPDSTGVPSDDQHFPAKWRLVVEEQAVRYKLRE